MRGVVLFSVAWVLIAGCSGSDRTCGPGTAEVDRVCLPADLATADTADTQIVVSDTGDPVDADQDGFPRPEDCDDHNPAVRPGAPEICDGVDNDCSGASDEPFDGDHDGFGDCLDCDDQDPLVNPGVAELCDGADNNCDRRVDEGFDLDGDGFESCRGDCDDSNADVHPWAVEICDLVDNDCNGTVDDGADHDGDGFLPCAAVQPDCDDDNDAVYPGAPEVCDGIDNDCTGALLPGERDVDLDGVMVCAGDCDDNDPLRALGFPELCDGRDNDCIPATTDDSDSDSDGQSACDGDCDDSDPLTFLGAMEACDGADNNCSGLADEGDVCGDCTVDWFGGHTYLFCDDPMDFDDSKAACEDFGYQFTAFSSAAEEMWASDVAWSIRDSTWRIGLTDEDEEGTFVWLNGEPVTYVNWAPSEPNDYGSGEDCTEILWSGYEWNDSGCTVSRRFICER